jgi:hypothetical protein
LEYKYVTKKLFPEKDISEIYSSHLKTMEKVKPPPIRTLFSKMVYRRNMDLRDNREIRWNELVK